MLERFHWPGNVRELENVMQRAIVMAKGEVILPGDLPPLISGGPTPGAEKPASRSPRPRRRIPPGNVAA